MTKKLMKLNYDYLNCLLTLYCYESLNYIDLSLSNHCFNGGIDIVFDLFLLY